MRYNIVMVKAVNDQSYEWQPCHRWAAFYGLEAIV